MSEIGNLDAMNEDELRLLSKNHLKLSQYAHYKSLAMALRKSGDIRNAMQIETYLDDLYRKLPEEWRW